MNKKVRMLLDEWVVKSKFYFPYYFRCFKSYDEFKVCDPKKSDLESLAEFCVKKLEKVGGEAERQSVLANVGTGKHDFANTPFGSGNHVTNPETKAGRGFSAPQITKKKGRK